MPRPCEAVVFELCVDQFRTLSTSREVVIESILHGLRAAGLCERGVRLRRQSPTPEQAVEMKTRYEEGTSLERIGAVLGYSAGTVGNHLLVAGVVLRDAHGRGEQGLAVRQTAGR